MTSTITQYSNLINANFPVPGEDNDSQGFRSNFSNIQSALTVASKEITNVQNNAVNLSDTNDFGNNVIKRASFQNCSVVVNDVGAVTSNVNVDYALGSYQKFSVDGGTYIFSVVNWPESGQCGTIRLEITPTSSETVNINFGGSVTILSKTPAPISYNQQTAIVWELWSPDNGSSIYAHELGLPNTTVTGTSIVAYSDIQISDNKYYVKPLTSATVVSNGYLAQELGLVPHRTTSTIVSYGCNSDAIGATTSTKFTLEDIKDIKPGALFWFNSTTATYTVESISGNQITTQVFNKSALTSDPVGTTLRFIATRFNQPEVLFTTNAEPTGATGAKYHLKGNVFLNDEKFWVSHRDHESGQGQWHKVALLNPPQYALFEKPVVLPQYTTETLPSAPVHDGALIFNTTINRPMYCVQVVPGFYTWNELCCGEGSSALTIDPSFVTITLSSTA